MNYLKTGILLILLTLLLILIGGLVGGREGAYIAFIIALLMNGISYWFSDKIVLAMYGAREVPKAEYPALYQVIESLTASAKLPMPKVYMIES
ncbi:MAG: protease HtpX, partial [Candidatus Omnitrophica bacterium]|nr:protease HtpX [Candidatus Omnitrophota bacterium]